MKTIIMIDESKQKQFSGSSNCYVYVVAFIGQFMLHEIASKKYIGIVLNYLYLECLLGEILQL